jgi:ribose transport system ATP-binding protein
MRVLAGHLPPTRGDLYLDERPITFTGPVDAEHRGIVLVHQEILLAPDLTVAQNLFLGRELRRGRFVDDRRMREESQAALDRLGARIDPDTEVHRLSIADRQLVQIARALLVPHRVVVFDEPTAVLTPIEAESLFEVIRRLRSRGPPCSTSPTASTR